MGASMMRVYLHGLEHVPNASGDNFISSDYVSFPRLFRDRIGEDFITITLLLSKLWCMSLFWLSSGGFPI
ncbi:MAG: hypothetical protein QMC86_06485 [Methanothermobacter sp.]|nr:hypothetical protein [Methanothermobacter sp.]